jgi:hypothetical protein
VPCGTLWHFARRKGQDRDPVAVVLGGLPSGALVVAVQGVLAPVDGLDCLEGLLDEGEHFLPLAQGSAPAGEGSPYPPRVWPLPTGSADS